MSAVTGLERGADGFYVLEMLGLAGWSVSVVAAGDGGSRVVATKGEHRVERAGATVADIALEVFEQARSLVSGRRR
ncbi:MAG TPA: hypothetical protein VM204_03455 [Gaiellaceae bacterium]|nr:hypothetical protein [Gaiellaceae bacterium]